MSQVDLYKSCGAHTYMYGERGRWREREEKNMFGERKHTERANIHSQRRKENRHPKLKADTMADHFNIALWN